MRTLIIIVGSILAYFGFGILVMDNLFPELAYAMGLYFPYGLGITMSIANYKFEGTEITYWLSGILIGFDLFTRIFI